MKPTLVILAAGMGSRYGGIKQIEPVGPNDEIILEYSIFDALRAGFAKVVLVIRPDIRKDFDTYVLPRFSSRVPCSYVFQNLKDLPPDVLATPMRKKPWGTAHAVLAARKEVREPFAVINADDFYGRDAFEVMAKFLRSCNPTERNYAVLGYELKKTISENGTVSRGICQVDAKGKLLSIVEHVKIRKDGVQIVSNLADGSKEFFDNDTPVSMNFFGFTPVVFPDMEAGFIEFLKTSGNDEKSEYLIPLIVNSIIRDTSLMHVLKSNAEWFGITYKEDRPAILAGIRKLVERGEYPSKLWV